MCISVIVCRMQKIDRFSPKKILNDLPLSSAGREKIASYRKEILDILQGKSSKILLIVGPCSIHDPVSAKEYAERLKSLQNDVKTDFFIVMRTYLEKSRTVHGWKGFVHDPALDGSSQIEKGLFLSRSLLLDLLEIGIPAGCEFLDPLSHLFFSDLISWGSIGARTVQSPVHRELASHLPMPIGFKNRTDGNVEIAIHAMQAAIRPHAFLSCNLDGEMSALQTHGNSLPHLVLRGGDTSENYHPHMIQEAASLLKKAGLNTKIIVDCSHGNSKKNVLFQKNVFASLLEQIRSGNEHICGIMLESNLFEGSQNISLHPLHYGISVTDPCLDWKTTQEMIYTACRLEVACTP